MPTVRLEARLMITNEDGPQVFGIFPNLILDVNHGQNLQQAANDWFRKNSHLEVKILEIFDPIGEMK